MTQTQLWTNARLMTCSTDLNGLGIVEHAALLTHGETILFAGALADLPASLRDSATSSIDVGNAWITPGFIDCHTHLIFGGDRSLEFERRLEGASYAELQQCGGGIFGTVAATAAASEQELLSETAARLIQMSRQGVTTVEIKSGYGLSPTAEIRLLRLVKKLQSSVRTSEDSLPDIVSTCLAAHALPPAFDNRREDYIRDITEQLLPTVAQEQLASAIDAFGEHIAFTPAEIETVFAAADALGFKVKLHADQLSDQNGAAIAAKFGALSADHLEYTSRSGVEAMATAGTVAVMLPVAFYTLRETQKPPVDLFRQAKVPMAVATDANPGSAPTLSLNLAMNMACVLFGLTVEEALLGVTRHAAAALGKNDRGVLQAGNRADFCIWDIERPAELIYWTGHPKLTARVQGGLVCES